MCVCRCVRVCVCVCVCFLSLHPPFVFQGCFHMSTHIGGGGHFMYQGGKDQNRGVKIIAQKHDARRWVQPTLTYGLVLLKPSTISFKPTGSRRDRFLQVYPNGRRGRGVISCIHKVKIKIEKLRPQT